MWLTYDVWVNIIDTHTVIYQKIFIQTTPPFPSLDVLEVCSATSHTLVFLYSISFEFLSNTKTVESW